MVWIVIEESMGFGGGGWDTGYYIYIICRGKVIKEIRAAYLEPTLGALKFAYKSTNTEYKIRKVDYPPASDAFCKALIKILCKETKGDIE